MRFTELGDDLGAGRVAVTKDARQVRRLAQGCDQFGRERRARIGKIGPVKRHRHTGELPMAGGRILSLRYFDPDSPGASHLCGCRKDHIRVRRTTSGHPKAETVERG